GSAGSLGRHIVRALTAGRRGSAPALQGRGAGAVLRSQARRVRRLLDRLDVHELAVVGHGFGGVVAELLALQGGVTCLVLIDAGPVDPSGAHDPGPGLGRAELAGLDVPTLVVWGEDGAFLPADQPERLGD